MDKKLIMRKVKFALFTVIDKGVNKTLKECSLVAYNIYNAIGVMQYYLLKCIANKSGIEVAIWIMLYIVIV